MMRVSKILHIGLLMGVLFLSSCRPRGVLSSEEMVAVLKDLHYAEAVLQIANYNYGHEEDYAKYCQQVLDNHGITQAQFDSSLVWYTHNPQLFNKIYPRVIKELKTERDEWNAAHPTAQELKMKEDIEEVLRPIEEIEREYLYGPHIWYFMGAEKNITPSDTTLLLPVGKHLLKADSVARLKTILEKNAPINRTRIRSQMLNRTIQIKKK